MRDAIIEMVRQYQRAAEAVEILDAQRVGNRDDSLLGPDARAGALRWMAECARALRNVRLPPQLTPEAAAPPHVVRLPPDLRTVGLTVPPAAADGTPPKAATLAEVLAAAKSATVQSAGPQLEVRPPQRLRDKIARAGLRMVLRALKLDPSPFEQVRRG